jgi:hypothetical protein
VGHNGSSFRSSSCRNHTGATYFPEQITSYLIKEASYRAVVGPFKDNPFNDPIALSPLNSVPKKDSSERRDIVDLSFPEGESVNFCILKDEYLGNRISVSYPKVEMFSSYVFKLTFRGLDRKLQHLPRQALPITLEILDKFYDHMKFNSSINVTYWCLFLFAFFLLSRKSNLVPVLVKKFDSSRQLCRGYITVCSTYLIVRFKWTKTIQFGNRVLSIPLLTFLVSKFCPVQAFKVMCSMNPCSSSSSAFSINYKGNIIPITYSKFQHRLRELIAKVGLNPKLFSSHSFRRGDATLGAQAGISSSLIQLMRDWKSDAFKKYIVCSLTDKFMVAEKIRDFILK